MRAGEINEVAGERCKEEIFGDGGIVGHVVNTDAVDFPSIGKDIVCGNGDRISAFVDERNVKTEHGILGIVGYFGQFKIDAVLIDQYRVACRRGGGRRFPGRQSGVPGMDALAIILQRDRVCAVNALIQALDLFDVYREIEILDDAFSVVIGGGGYADDFALIVKQRAAAGAGGNGSGKLNVFHAVFLKQRADIPHGNRVEKALGAADGDHLLGPLQAFAVSQGKGRAIRRLGETEDGKIRLFIRGIDSFHGVGIPFV